MAVSGKANSVYVVDSLLADLKRITRANGYMTDVKTVKDPDYWPDDNDWKTLLAEEAPAVLVWLDDESDPNNRQSIAEDRPVLRLYIVGLVKAHRGVRAAVQGLAADVRRIMRENPMRNHPDYSGSNLWGVNTQSAGARTFAFMGKRVDQLTTAGIFESFWEVEYRFPRSTG